MSHSPTDAAAVRVIRDDQAARLPGGWVQVFLTWLSAKPFTGQAPLYYRTYLDHLAEGLLKLFVGISLAVVAVQYGSWAWGLLPFAWMCTVGGARQLQVNIVHQCVHQNFTGKAVVDRGVAQAITSLLLVQDFDGYYEDHVETHHKGKYFATKDDPDMAFLIALGFRPGMDKKALWRKLAWTLVSPRFHALFLKARFRANFVTPGWGRVALAATVWGSVLAATALTGSWLLLALVAVVPLGPLYHVSALLQFVSEHFWVRVPGPGEKGLSRYARYSHGRFLIAPLPAPGLPPARRLVGWAKWGAVTSGMAVVRFTCLVADLPVHDWHHLFALDPNWPNAIWEREQRVQTDPVKGPLFQDTIGLFPAIDRCLDSISKAPPLPAGVAVRDNSDYLGM